jgi:hypothetical protein
MCSILLFKDRTLYYSSPVKTEHSNLIYSTVRHILYKHFFPEDTCITFLPTKNRTMCTAFLYTRNNNCKLALCLPATPTCHVQHPSFLQYAMHSIPFHKKQLSCTVFFQQEIERHVLYLPEIITAS